MNSNFHKLLLILLVFSTATASARKMASTKAAGEVDQQIKGEESDLKVASVDSFDKLMGVEECGNGETECLMRRAVSEAHLDYIYTEKKGN
ncbi:putative phytosulfokines 6 isoform X1 [Salvia splendens]|uniref:putative phytosulfokines 6 isoform X1 n=1 Tax=Salvia splendens TaxID=180675 RepID=UPI00110353EB|nr:putative phytosulfokines 6 isoform X1 [Salvia splendens]